MKKMIIFIAATMLLMSNNTYAMLQACFRYLNADLSTATLIETFNVPQTTTYEITEPGIYLLAQDYILSTTEAIPAIHIKASGVQLDLNQRMIANDGFTEGVMGIQVDPGLTGISITNGVIGGFTDTAIAFGEGTSFIQLEDLVFKNCFSRVLDLVGTLGSPLTEGIMQRIVISQCSVSDVADAVINIEHANNFYLNDVGISACGNIDNTMTMFQFSNVQKSQLVLPAAVDNVGASLTAFNLSACENVVFSGAKVIGNNALGSGGVLAGVNIISGSAGNIFKDLIVLNNTSNQGACLAVSIGTTCNGNLFAAAQLLENVGTSFVGINLVGAGSPSDNYNNAIRSSFILRNRSTDGSCTGILINNSDKGALHDTQVGFNVAVGAGAIATGLLFQSGTGGDEWAVRGCEFFKNEGPNQSSGINTDSYGVHIQTGTNNIFIQNIAYQNGANKENQLKGTIFPFSLAPLTSVQYVTDATVILATAPWINVAVVDVLPLI